MVSSGEEVITIYFRHLFNYCQRVESHQTSGEREREREGEGEGEEREREREERERVREQTSIIQKVCTCVVL